jgi:hypothetical protein
VDKVDLEFEVVHVSKNYKLNYRVIMEYFDLIVIVVIVTLLTGLLLFGLILRV